MNTFRVKVLDLADQSVVTGERLELWATVSGSWHLHTDQQSQAHPEGLGQVGGGQPTQLDQRY